MAALDVRAAVLARFKTDGKGRITDPGRFQGEQIYVPFFYDLVLNGEGDGEEVVTVKVEAPDREAFPELKKREAVVLWCKSDGVVQELHPELEGKVYD
jgi:hypothetical protein